MPGPLHAPHVLVLFPFHFRDPVSGKWVRARYVAERHVIADRYREWGIIGEPEFRRTGEAGHFNPWRPPPNGLVERPMGVDSSPTLRDDERPLVLLFLRRYIAYCARRQRFAQMEGAARLFREV